MHRGRPIRAMSSKKLGCKWSTETSKSGPSCRSSKELGSPVPCWLRWFIARIELMMTASELLALAWTYPLFEALYGRRSRRFGLGFEMPEGPFRYKSVHRPVPLSELEEALLVGAGAGFSGLAFWDLPTPPLYRGRGRSGRTFPTTRPGGHTALFFTNDEGFYVLDANVAASKLREIETPDERGKLLEAYRAQRRLLRGGRLDIPRRVPP